VATLGFHLSGKRVYQALRPPCEFIVRVETLNHRSVHFGMLNIYNCRIDSDNEAVDFQVYKGSMWTSAAVIVLFGMLGLVPTQISPTQHATACDDSALPASVRDLLKAQFPEWRPKRVSDMDSEYQQLWLSSVHGEECPGIATGHFETVPELSYAILLVPKSNPSGGHKVVVASKGEPKSTYTWKLLDHAEGQTYSGLVISKAPPGKYSDWENTKSIRLKLDGITVEWMEKGAVLYFWSEGRYHKIQTSD
jgi:hypothetical protein